MDGEAEGRAVSEPDGAGGTLTQRVHAALREAILTMGYPPGTLLRKAEICDRFGVSRSPVSDAIARLAAEGLVDVVPQSGSRVSSFSMAEVREASFLRDAVESAAVAKVALDRTEAQAALLVRNMRQQERRVAAGDHAGFYRLDEEFHAILMEATGYPGVASVAAGVSLQLKRARLLLLPEDGRPQDTLDEHRAILDAVLARDPQAARAAMTHHLGQLLTRIAPLEQKYPDFFRTQ